MEEEILFNKIINASEPTNSLVKSKNNTYIQFIENNLFAIFEINQSLTITRINKSMAYILGFIEEELENKNIETLLNSDNPIAFNTFFTENYPSPIIQHAIFKTKA